MWYYAKWIEGENVFINFICPPTPHLIVGGISIFRKGDRHEKRSIHKSFDLIFVKQGCLNIDENGKRFDINEGEFLILRPEFIHFGYRHCVEDTIFYWVHFYTEGDYSYTDDEVTFSTQKMNKNKYYQKDEYIISLPQFGSADKETRNEILRLFEKVTLIKINKYNQEKLFFDSITSQIDYQISFMQIVSIICGISECSEKKDLAQDIYEYFKQAYTEPFSLTDLSHRFSFHPVYITRCVKNRFGVTPLHLLTQIRIEEAKRLLQSTDFKVNIIGQEVGYYDSAYFSKIFKKHTGLTANQYRRKERE